MINGSRTDNDCFPMDEGCAHRQPKRVNIQPFPRMMATVSEAALYSTMSQDPEMICHIGVPVNRTEGAPGSFKLHCRVTCLLQQRLHYTR